VINIKGSGNGNVETCVENLLKIVQGEVPYSRLKGVDGDLIDQPNASEELISDAEELIEEYEERARIDDIYINAIIDSGGDFVLTASISETEIEDSEDDEEVGIIE
jgi:phage baseplate assembly protein W